MENITKVLGSAPGIQWQGEQDNTQSTAINAMNVGIIVGQFKRGRVDKPFRVSAATIEARLGYDPTNFDYMAVQDVLDLGVPYVWVQRIRAGVNASASQPAQITSSGASGNLNYYKAITSGSLVITVNGVAYNLTGLTFASAGSLSDVALLLQSALNNKISSAAITVVYSAISGQFTLTTALLGSSASIIFTGGDILPIFGFDGLGAAVGGVTPIGTDYTPIAHHIFINESGAIALGVGAVANPTNTALKITFALHDILDEGCDLELKFYSRAGATLTSGKPTAINDIQAELTFKDSLTKKQLYSFTGLLAANTKGITLAQVAQDSNVFSTFTVTLLGDNANTADAIITSLAGNLPNTLGRKKVTLAVPTMAGASATIPASFYELMFNRLSYGDLRPNYLAIAQTDNLSLINCLMRIAEKRNCLIFGDIDPTLPLDSAMAVSSGIEAKTALVSWFFNATKSRPRDAETVSGAKVFRPSVGVLLGYTLLRNANTNKQGIPPLQIPIAGYDYPLPFKGMELRSDIFYDQDTLDRLADQGVAINPVILHQGNEGSRFIFGDLKTQYDDDGDSPLTLINSTEILVYTANAVLDIISRYLRTGMDEFIEFAERDCRAFLDNCFSAGLLKAADNLGGKPYTLSITPREDRPFDAVDVSFARRPAGAARAAFLNTSVEK